MLFIWHGCKILLSLTAPGAPDAAATIQLPFAFTGEIAKLMVELKPSAL